MTMNEHERAVYHQLRQLHQSSGGLDPAHSLPLCCDMYEWMRAHTPWNVDFYHVILVYTSALYVHTILRCHDASNHLYWIDACPHPEPYYYLEPTSDEARHCFLQYPCLQDAWNMRMQELRCL